MSTLSPVHRLLVVLLLFGGACKKEIRELKRPNRVRLDPSGRLVVSDFHHQRLVVFDLDGQFIEAVGHQGTGDGELWQVFGMAVTRERTVVVNRRVKSLDDKDMTWEIKVFQSGKQVAVHPLKSQEEGTWPQSIAPLPDGGYLLADRERHLISVLGPDFELRTEWRQPPGGEPFGDPDSLRVTEDHIWLVESYRHRVRRLGLDGRQQLLFGEEGRARGQLRFPSAVDACPGKWAVVADLGNYRVQRFDYDGGLMDTFEPPATSADKPVQLMDVVVGAGCERLYLADSKGNRILVTRPDGTPIRTIDRW